MRLLEKPAFPLQKSAGRRETCQQHAGKPGLHGGFSIHGAIPVILDRFDLNLPATHRDGDGVVAEVTPTLG